MWKETTRLQRELPAHLRVYSRTLPHRETCSLARVWTGYESASARLHSIFSPSRSHLCSFSSKSSLHLFSFSSKSSLRVLSRKLECSLAPFSDKSMATEPGFEELQRWIFDTLAHYVPPTAGIYLFLGLQSLIDASPRGRIPSLGLPTGLSTGRLRTVENALHASLFRSAPWLTRTNGSDPLHITIALGESCPTRRPLHRVLTSGSPLTCCCRYWFRHHW